MGLSVVFVRMYDDDELHFTKKVKTIHYGSLEETEKQRLQTESIESDEEDYEPATKKVLLGNINTSNEYFDLENEM